MSIFDAGKGGDIWLTSIFEICSIPKLDVTLSCIMTLIFPSIFSFSFFIMFSFYCSTIFLKNQFPSKYNVNISYSGHWIFHHISTSLVHKSG